MENLRIVSLFPAATEMVYALGLEKNLVGVSDDSDYPESVRNLPKVVTTTLPQGLSSREIDKRVRAAKHKGIGIFHIDQKILEKLAPNLILSQELCEICAIGASEVKKAARILKSSVRTVSLEPQSVENVMDNTLLIGLLTGENRGAEKVVRKLKKRVNNIKQKTKNLKRKPRILIIEWINPIMVAGHWVPEMVEIAGGANLISKKGEISKRITLGDVLKENPDILIISPCGFDIVRTRDEIRSITTRKGYANLKAVQNNQVYYIDGNAFLTRPGPRIVDGIEILAEIIHPDLFNRKYPKTSWDKVL